VVLVSDFTQPHQCIVQHHDVVLSLTASLLAGPFLSLLALILLAGGCLLSFFIVLSGGVNGSPINKVYFLEAATGGIGNSPPTAAWTWNAVCTYTGGLTSACRKAQAAPPFDPTRNFGTTTGLPASFASYVWVISLAARFIR